MRLALRGFGWLFIASGAVIALFLVYSLYWTGLATQRAQESFLDEWNLQVGTIEGAEEPVEATADAQALTGVDVGESVAAMQFYRPGSLEVPVYEDPLFVVEGVTAEALGTGPGHYPGTALPGEMGNFAVAGHRTTAGAPFYNLETIEEGDEIHITDRNGTRWIYQVLGQEIVAPTDNQVLRRDPLDSGRPMLTLTTCNPRWSNRERLVVFAQLSEDQMQLVQA